MVIMIMVVEWGFMVETGSILEKPTMITRLSPPPVSWDLCTSLRSSPQTEENQLETMGKPVVF